MGRNLADVEYKMRMTQDLKEKIVESAKAHNRSMNADIIARLEQSFKIDEADANGEVVLTENSRHILERNLQATISELIVNLLDAGVEAEKISNASKAIKSKK